MDPERQYGNYGSTVGLRFQRTSDQAQFCIGMECPSSAFDSLNSVLIKNGDDTAGTARAVEHEGEAMGSIKLGGDPCTITRSDKWGSVNYCLCLIGK
jgi:hypothetical protein